MPTLAHVFTTRADAVTHQAAVTDALGLPIYYTAQALKDGVIREVGRGRHVAPELIISQPVPILRVALAGGAWAVDVAEGEGGALGTPVELDDTQWVPEDDAGAPIDLP